MAIIIETTRLLLRPLEDKDLHAYTEIMTKHEVTQFIGSGQDKSEEDVKAILQCFQQIQMKHNIILHGVIEKHTKKLIGHCGFLPLSNRNGFELLYALDSDAWGKGYATEASKACIDYAKKHYDWQEVYAMFYPQNKASKNVLSKLGFRHFTYEDFNDIKIELVVLDLK